MASIATDWVKSMKLCKFHGQRPAKVNDIVNKNIWIGAAIYRGDFGKQFWLLEWKYNFDFNSLHSE